LGRVRAGRKARSRRHKALARGAGLLLTSA